MKKRALITGINGMDGSHLADFLLTKNYDVFGLIRKTPSDNLINILDKITLYNCDLTDLKNLTKIVNEINPDEIYNLGSESFIGKEWDSIINLSNAITNGTLHLLEIIKNYKTKKIKLFQAGSSEMYGNFNGKVDYDTPFNPTSIYGTSKVFSHNISNNYRNVYDLYVVNGILFNHESERRKHHFITRKITDGVAKIKLGLIDNITIGDLQTKRDWGYSPDFVKGMWLSMQQDTSDNYIFCTGIVHSIKDLLNNAFNVIGINNWSKYVLIDNNFNRINEEKNITGDLKKTNKSLNWLHETNFEDMIKKMVLNDIKINEKSIICK